MKNKTHRYLILAAVFLMLFSIFMSLFTFWYLAHNQEVVNVKLQNSLREELANYDIPKPQEPLSIDDAKILLAVAKYCEVHNNCRGYDGGTIQGPVGTQGVMGLLGEPGQQGLRGDTGMEGPQGQTGDQGVEGPTGQPGKTLEQRCTVVDPTTRRIEQKYIEGESWEVLYYLSEGQTCPGEEL